MDLTVVIINYNTKDLLKNCLESIFSKKWQHQVKVMVVDNNSSDQSLQMVRKDFPQVNVVESEYNLGFSGGNNLGLKEIDSKYILLLNSDTEVLNNSLDNLIDFMEKSDFGIGSCKLVDGEGKFQPNIGELPTFWPLFIWLSGLDDILGKFLSIPSYQARGIGYYSKERETGWVSGAAMIIRRDVFEKIGLMDENIFMYGEDVEFCMRAKKSGFKIGWTNKSTIIHLGGKSSVSPKYKQWLGEFKGLIYIYKKYYGFLRCLILRLLIYKFILLRVVAFFILGKTSYSKIYAKIIVNL